MLEPISVLVLCAAAALLLSVVDAVCSIKLKEMAFELPVYLSLLVALRFLRIPRRANARCH